MKVEHFCYYLFDLNGAPIGSYEEASALFASNIIRQRSSSSHKGKHDVGPGSRRSRRRVLNLKPSSMGSNISRRSGKGLSGRRAHSSGNLCKLLAPRVGRIFHSCGDGGGGVRPRGQNKFCGSLPSHLDKKEVPSGDCTPETLYSGNNNYGETHKHAQDVDLLFHKLLPLQGGSQGTDLKHELPSPVYAEATFPFVVIRRSSDIPFSTKENTFEVRLEKDSRGLGLSVTGGVETAEQYPGLIRIKRIFPHQPAWECGALEMGDIILSANGTPLTGLSNHEALEVLRTTPSDVLLKVCRPPAEIFSRPLPNTGEPPPPPKRDPAQYVLLSSQSGNAVSLLPLPAVMEPYGEFGVTLKKVSGSLGFTLRKEDESVLGHYVRALVREPAISDGRIRPGDKIVSVNGIDMSPMSHEEAVVFLRQCGEEVHLRLYRDPAQTPVSALSPTESHKIFRPKPALRKEAMDMLCDLAVRKLNPSDSSGSSGRSRFRSTSPGSSPRRRKLSKTPTEQESKVERPGYLDLEGTLRGQKNFVEEEERRQPGDVFPGNEGTSPSEPASMPQMPTSSEFSHKNPLYQSAHPAIHVELESEAEAVSGRDVPEVVFKEGTGSHSLLKWKGVVFTPEDGIVEGKNKKTMTDSPSNTEEVLTVELCRGWNSRLGFSLQSSHSGTLISAIYPDSVASKDGRLHSGDQIVMINDEPTKDMSTSDVIDLLRKVRGTIAITVVRSGGKATDGRSTKTSSATLESNKA